MRRDTMCHHREATAEWEALARKAYENREEERTESDVEGRGESDVERTEPEAEEKAEPPIADD